MGPSHAAPVVTQWCGPVFNVSGHDDKLDLAGSNLSGSKCTQSTTTIVKGGNTKVKVAPTFTPLPELLQNLAASGINLSSIKTLTVANQQNQGVQVANATNSNPGVVIADKSMLYAQQPGVEFYNNTFENAGAKYYDAVLQNPGV